MGRREATALVAPADHKDLPAGGAGRVRRQPRVNAGNMEPVSALGQNPHLVTFCEVREADGATGDELAGGTGGGGGGRRGCVGEPGEGLEDLLLDALVGVAGGRRSEPAIVGGSTEAGAADDGDEARHADQGAQENGEDDDEVGLHVRGIEWRRRRGGGGGEFGGR